MQLCLRHIILSLYTRLYLWHDLIGTYGQTRFIVDRSFASGLVVVKNETINSIKNDLRHEIAEVDSPSFELYKDCVLQHRL